MSAANEVPEEPEDRARVRGSGSEFGPRPGQQKCSESEKKEASRLLLETNTKLSKPTAQMMCEPSECECVGVGVGVCGSVVGNSASCAANQLMMLLTLPQPAELDKQQLSGLSGRKSERKREIGREREGESAHWLLTLDEPRWSTIFKRYVNI